MAETGLNVEVACAVAGEVELVSLVVSKGATVNEVIAQSGILDRCAITDSETTRTGIFGKLCAAETVVREGDRIEIYHPLRADPKEARRKRALRKTERR